MLRPYAVPLFLATLAGSALADPPPIAAPYGLTWKQSKAAVEALGTKLTGCEQQETTEVCDLAAVPQPPAGIIPDFFRVRFDAEGLTAVTLASATIASDPDGATGKTVYEALRKDIVAVYGEGERTEKVGQIMPYMAPNEFYECLDFDGCGTWETRWSGGDLVLGLKGLKPGEGYVMVNYYRP